MPNTIGLLPLCAALTLALSATTSAEAIPSPPTQPDRTNAAPPAGDRAAADPTAQPKPSPAAQVRKAELPPKPNPPTHVQIACAGETSRLEGAQRAEEQLSLLKTIASNTRALTVQPLREQPAPSTVVSTAALSSHFEAIRSAFPPIVLGLALLLGPALSIFMTRRALRAAGLL